MLVFTILVPIVLVFTYLVIFPKTKGVMRPLKVPVDKNKF